jgi:SAM-dependent methyltransferase
MAERSAIRAAAEKLKAHRSLARAYFELLYLKKHAAYRDSNPDYEKQRDFAFSVLEGSGFAAGLEVGCGEGFTTGRVAERCERVVATDVSGIAVKRARELNSHLAGVEFRQHDLVNDSLDDEYDYVFVAEVLYYVTREQFPGVVEKLASCVRPGGTLHLLHHRATGDDDVGVDKAFGAKTIHDAFVDRDEMTVVADQYGDYNRLRASVLTRKPA